MSIQLSEVLQLINNSTNNIWLNGTYPPNSNIGEVGSYYINVSNGDYYTKTSGITWVLLGNLTGSVWLNGITAPYSNLGSVNDYYIDTTTRDYYTKNTATTWILLGNLGGNVSGGDLNYTFNQIIPSDVWYIIHNLGKNPSVSTVDSAGNFVVGLTTYINTSTLQINFAAAMAGQAFLN